jgi:hypothetical protein
MEIVMNTRDMLKQRTKMGEIILSKTMNRVRPDEKIEIILIEIDAPEEHLLSGKNSHWTCNLRLSGLPQIITCSGLSSLDAVSSASYMAADILKSMPFAGDIDMSLLPNYGLPVSPLTSPADLAKEQERADKLEGRLALSWYPQKSV